MGPGVSVLGSGSILGEAPHDEARRVDPSFLPLTEPGSTYIAGPGECIP